MYANVATVVAREFRYLPEVAADQGWDQATAVESLIRKAGFHGRITPVLLEKLQCTRYQSSKTRATFDEYVQVRGEHARRLLDNASAASASATTAWSESRPNDHHARGHSSSNANCVIS